MSQITPDDNKRANVFISYSRVDIAFARKIASALESKNIHVLIDQEDIGKWEAWWERITQLISQADTVVFLISPDWMLSDTCKKELAFAEELKKRLSPIIYKSVKAAEINDALKKFNFFYFNPEDNFSNWLDEIVENLLINIEWVRENTRLGDLAFFWKLQNKQPANLLREMSLLSAERWLSQKPSRAVPVSDLLADFLKTSREVWEEEERIKKERIQRVMISQSELLAEKSGQVTVSGDAVSGILLCLEGLPDSSSGIDRPAVRQTEIACFNAMNVRHEECVFECGDDISKSVFTPDGKRLLTRSCNEKYEEINVWDIASGKCVMTLNGEFADFSSEGDWIAVANKKHQVSLYDTETLANTFVLTGHTKKIEEVVFSQQYSKLVTVSADGAIWLWELSSGKKLSDTEKAKKTILYFTPANGYVLLNGKSKKILKVSNLKKITGITKDFEGAAVSPDGNTIAFIPALTYSFDTSIQILDIHSGKQTLLEGHEGIVLFVAFSPDGNYIVTASADNTARIWDTKKGKLLHILQEHTDDVGTACFNANSQLIATMSFDNSFIIWSIYTGQALFVMKGHAGDSAKSRATRFWSPTISFSADSQRLATTWKDKTARIWKTEPLELNHILSEHTKKITGVSIHPGGKYFATSSEDKRIIIWDINTCEQLKSFTLSDKVIDVAFTHDGTMLAGITGNAIWLWKSFSEEKITKTTIKGSFNGKLQFSPDDSNLLILESLERAAVYDIHSARLVTTIETDTIYSAVYSPDGNSIVTTGDERVIRFWDAKTGQALSDLMLGHGSSVYGAYFNQAGTRLIAALDELYATIWNIGTDPSQDGNLIQLEGHEKEVLYAAFSPDGKQALTACADGNIRIYDSETGVLLFMLTAQLEAVTKAVFTPGGEKIVSISDDNTICISDLFTTTDSLVSYAKKIVPRLLTREQRVSFFLDPEPPKWYLTSGKWPYKNIT